jgi:hypothetical protein
MIVTGIPGPSVPREIRAGAVVDLVGTARKAGSNVPYRSLAQEGYFHSNKKKLEAQGVDVDEWDKATKGKHLPKRVVKKTKPRKRG